MAAVLTESDTLTCTHAGTVSPSGSQKLKVAGKGVLTQADVSSWSFTGCTPTKQTDVACTQVSSIKPSASKLKANGSPVILAGGTAQSNGTPPTLTETAGNSKLQAS
jgi:hypothetical protein